SAHTEIYTLSLHDALPIYVLWAWYTFFLVLPPARVLMLGLGVEAHTLQLTCRRFSLGRSLGRRVVGKITQSTHALLLLGGFELLPSAPRHPGLRAPVTT